MKIKLSTISLCMSSIIIAVVIYFIFASVSSIDVTGKIERGRSASDLFFNFYRHGGIIVYPSSDELSDELSDKFRYYADNLSRRFRRSKLIVMADTTVTDDNIKNFNLILLGSYRSNKVLHRFGKSLPVNFSRDKFIFSDRVYGNPDDLVNFIYPNPFNDQKALIIISGNNDEQITKNFSLRFAGDLRISNGYQCLLMANFIKTENGKWITNKDEIQDFSAKQKVLKITDHYTFISHSDKLRTEIINEITGREESSAKKLQDFFGKTFRLIHINYNLYPSFEDKGLIINNTTLSNFIQSDSSVHTVINDNIRGDDFSKDVILFLRANFGRPKTSFLETGLSIYFSRNWREKGYRYWASRIFLSDNVPSLQDLTDTVKSDYLSYLIVEPLAGTFVDFIISKLGKENFIKNYKNWQPSKNEITMLDAEWRKYLLKISSQYKRQIETDRKNFPDDTGNFLKGFSYAHVGYDIYNGYLSEKSFTSLKKLASLGTNAISITPFTSVRDPQKPEPLSFWQSPYAENDESLIFLKETADSLHLTVMLKPHIWLMRGWPGDIKMKNKNDWNKFFYYYYLWIRHYALLAEMYKIPILCIGNELSGTTVGHEAQWIEIVHRLRKLYSGKITYGANWDNEFEKLLFWKYFDYIGVSQYYPLSRKKNPTDEELLESADSVIQRIDTIRKKFNKPVLFTELGYRSSNEPWETALETNPKPDSSLTGQERCYKAILKASYNHTWLAGMFWWKWPSYLDYGGDPERDLYTPLNKPAEQIIKKWYSKSWE